MYMTGTKYLSQIGLTPERFISGKINIIKCNTGAGKTYFALKELPKLANSNHCILYITDTNMNKEQLINNYEETEEYNNYWRKFINKSDKSKIIQRTKRKSKLNRYLCSDLLAEHFL